MIKKRFLPWVSVISVRPQYAGTKILADRFTTQLYGSVPVVKQSVTRLQRTVTHRWYRNIPEFRCLHIILQQRSHGYFRTYQKQKRQQIRENLQ